MARPRAALSPINLPELGTDAYISFVKPNEWDEYFSIIAEAAAQKSKDPRCRVGAVIVSADRIVITTGFNGLPRGVQDDEDILDDADEKLKVICHAEQNAIINAARMGISVRGASIYVTKFPCLACCSSIIQAGITRIYTSDSRYWDDDPFDGTKNGNHWRKRRLIRGTHIIVDAPNHPEYSSSIRIRKKRPRGTRLGGRSGTGS